MKKLVVILTAAVVATGAVTTNLWLDLRAEHGKAAELATRVTAAESVRLASAVTSPPESVASLVEVMPQPAAAPAAIAGVPASPSVTGAATPPMKGMLEAMASPEGQDATRTMMRGMMAMMYPDIEAELGLTRQEKEKLFDLMADEGVDSASLMLGGAQDPAARREMQRKVVESERAQEAKLAALLGSKYPKWEEYQSTAAARQQLTQLRQALSAAGNPLSDAQSTQLEAAFAVELRRYERETRGWSTSAEAINSPNMMQETMLRAVGMQSRLVDVAAPVLDSAQQDRYKRQVEQQTAMLRATMGLMGAGDAP